MMKIQNDIIQAMDKQGGAILVLLDLFAAFDKINHQVMLLQILHRDIGVTGKKLFNVLCIAYVCLLYGQ